MVAASSVVAPAVVALTALMWVTLPGWLLVAAALAPVLPGRWRALRVLWLVLLYATLETLLLAVLLGLWLASGFGWRIRSPYFAGIHYDLVQGTLIVFVREARRVLAQEMRQPGDAPGLVQGGGAGDPVADPAVDRRAVIGEAPGDVAVLPAAKIG